MSGDDQRAAQQPPTRLPDRGEGFRQQLVQRRVGLPLQRALVVQDLLFEALALALVGAAPFGLALLRQAGLDVAHPGLKQAFELGRLRLDLGVWKVLQATLVLVDTLHDRANALELPVEARAHDRLHQLLKHVSQSRYNPWVRM